MAVITRNLKFTPTKEIKSLRRKEGVREYEKNETEQ